MEGPSETVEETPKINLADYINRMEILDAHADRQRGRGLEAITEEFYGELDGWEEESNRFIHDIVTVRLGIRMYTKASREDRFGPDRDYLNAPEKVEHYQLWITCGKETARLFINTADRNLAREIHDAFFSTLMAYESLERAVDWLARTGEYGSLKCATDASVPLIDFMPKSARKKAQAAM